MAQLVIIRGLPGSGKTTIAKKEFPNHFHTEADQWFIDPQTGEYRFDPTKLNGAHRGCQAATFKALQSGHDVVVTNTFTQNWEFDSYFDICDELEIEDILVIEMKTQYQNIHGVPEEKMEVMRRRWHAWGSFEVPECVQYQEVWPIRTDEQKNCDCMSEDHFDPEAGVMPS
jgi:predicted kinase